MPDQGINRAAYDRVAARWDQARVAFYGDERRYLDALLQGLAWGSSILDLGCGTGRPMAADVVARGHRLTGVDQAANMLAIARSRMPQATWIESSIEEFDLPGPYDGVICWDALFHIARTRHGEILARIAAALRPGGRMMVTVGGSAHPAFTDTMFGEEFFYDSLPPDEMLALLQGLDFATVITEFMNVPTGGRDKGRYAIVAQLR